MRSNIFRPPEKLKESPDRAPAVRLKRKVKLDGKWTFATIARKGDRYLWDEILVNGTPRKVTGGSFFVEWVMDGRKIQKSLKTLDPVAASDAKAALEGTLEHQRQGIVSEDTLPPAVSGGRSVKRHFDDYLHERRHSLGPLSIKKYRKDLDRFLSLTTKRYVSQVTREDIVRHVNLLLDGGMAPITAKNDTTVVLTVCRAGGATIKMERGDWPRIVDEETEIYTLAELKQLFEHADPYETVAFKIFLKTGFRDREGIHLSWPDVDWKKGMLSVTAKPEFKFKPKNYEERAVSVPDSLLELMREHRKTQATGTYFVLATKKKGSHLGGSRPDKQLLEKLKALAFRAELNCGRCTAIWKGNELSCRTSPICGQWYLHKFRATFITEMLRSSVDLRTVQKLAGHKLIETTAKYLRPLEDDRLRERTNSSSLADI